MRTLILGVLLLTAATVGLCEEKVFDFHVHLWNGDASVKEYLAQLESGPQRMDGFGGILIAKQGEIARTRAKNDELIALRRKYPKLMPIASVHPYDGAAALEEVKRLAAAGVKVIKVHPHTQEFVINDPRVAELVKLAGTLGIIMMFDNANIVPGDCQDLFNLAVRNPDTQFIFAHLGAFNFRFWNILLAAHTAKDFYKDNIHFDIAATVFYMAGSPMEKEFVWTMRNVGIDNILLGSDYPQYSLKDNADALNKLDLTPAEKEKIRWGNAQRMFFSNKK